MRHSPTIFIVPTGIGCEIGGFAGDALPVAKLLASASGCLVTHPNVMNGGSLSEKDERIFYVEGFHLDQFAKGKIGLQRVNQQKIGIIFDSSIDKEILERHLQVVDACIATLGINIESYVVTDEPLGVVINNQDSGISGGIIKNPATLISAGEKLLKKGITAIAIVANFPDQSNIQEVDLYREGNGIDPISGAEAVISHIVSKFLKVPCAHAPALMPIDLKYNLDPRAAAEEIGYTFLPSVLIGLSTAPDLVDLDTSNKNISLHPDDIDSIVVPSGALGGEAVLACMERDIRVISVVNSGILDINNSKLKYQNFIEVNNYFEAAGIILSFREGINHKSIRRPLKSFKDSQVL
tara:strand:- start:8751 stop:9806 length:1056 start_codon:yes stop_codon:yes gene_type:complete